MFVHGERLVLHRKLWFKTHIVSFCTVFFIADCPTFDLFRSYILIPQAWNMNVIPVPVYEYHSTVESCKSDLLVSLAKVQVEGRENSFALTFAAHYYPKRKLWLADHFNDLAIKIVGSSLSTNEISLS